MANKTTTRIIDSASLAVTLLQFQTISSVTSRSDVNKDYSSVLKSYGSRLSTILESQIAAAFGMKRVPSRSGTGVVFDYIDATSEYYELKAIRTTSSFIKEVEQAVRAESGIKVGATGVTVTKGSTTLLTSASLSGDTLTKQYETFDESVTDTFLRKYSKNLRLLKQHLIRPESIRSDQINREGIVRLLQTIRQNLSNKANNILIPTYLGGSKVGIATIQFTEDMLFKNGSFLTVNGSPTSVSVNIKFTKAQLNSILVDANKQISSSLSSTGADIQAVFERKLLESVKSSARFESFAASLGARIQELERALNTTLAQEVIAPKGSVLAYSARIKGNARKPIKRSTADLGIINISSLVRGRTRLRMRRGGGQPNPPKIYERSGTFRASIQAVANLRTGIVNYYYLPYYDSLERYGYQIQDLVEGSIRAIVRERFNSTFNLRRIKG